MAQQQAAKLPFSIGTRRNRVPLQGASLPANGNAGTITIPVPRNGLGSRIVLRIQLTANTGAGTPAWGNNLEREMALLPSIVLQNNANLIPVNISMYGMSLYLQTQRRGFTVRGQPGYAGALPAASSTFTWNLTIAIPLSFNQGLNFDTGLLMLQSNSADWNLQLNFAALSTVITGVTTTLTASAIVGYLDYYEVPDTNRYMSAPLNAINVIAEEIIPGSQLPANGEYQRELSPLQGDMIKLIGQFVQGAAPATFAGLQYFNGVTPSAGTGFITTKAVILNNLINPERMDAFLTQSEFFEDYGSTPEAGVLVYLDGALETGNPGEFSYPLYAYQQLNPSLFASVRTSSVINANGATLAYFRLIRNYLQAIAYQG